MSEFLAKPTGITLKEHVEHLLTEAEALFNMLPFSFEKYKKYTGEDLFNQLVLACKTHDTGKKNPGWQAACQQDYSEFLKWEKLHSGDFSQFEKNNKGIAGKCLRKAGVRHEIYSVLYNTVHNLPLPVKVAIAAHHGKLNAQFQDKWEIAEYINPKKQKISGKEFWQELYNYIKNITPETWIKYFEQTVSEYYKFTGIRGFLILTDHWASAKEGNEEIPPINKFEYAFNPTWNKRPVQQLAEQNWEQDLLLLRAPTGAGKTDACLLWAKKQIDNNKAERLIIAMPTRFTSNSLEIGIAETISQTGLYHSTAFYNKYEEKVSQGVIKNKEAKTAHKFARYLLTPVTVCTIDHLLMSLTLTREDHHITNFNLANSCLVIDEADFYDDFTQQNIIVLLKALKTWKVPVMLMSASLPQSSVALYKQSGYCISEIMEDTSDLVRKRCDIKEIRSYEKVAEIEDLLQKCIKKGNAIIYVNTIARAFEFYEWFEKHNITPVIYHSRFTEPHKAEKEKELIALLGKEAWNNRKAKGIAIMTQIGEMSVNISAEIMISELCPIDRLVQRVGRLERFSNDKVGELYVIAPERNNNPYPAPYGEFDRKKKKWQPVESYTKTSELLACKSYSASDFVKFINLTYEKNKVSDRAENNARNLYAYFLNNWLIGSKELSRDDDTSTTDWKSRNIANNVTVFSEFPEQREFYYYNDFMKLKMETGIDIYPYLFQKGIDKGSLKKVEIKVQEEIQSVYYAADENVYNKITGLNIERSEDVFL